MSENISTEFFLIENFPLEYWLDIDADIVKYYISKLHSELFIVF